LRAAPFAELMLELPPSAPLAVNSPKPPKLAFFKAAFLKELPLLKLALH
jgi:hypothetical protein